VDRTRARRGPSRQSTHTCSDVGTEIGSGESVGQAQGLTHGAEPHRTPLKRRRTSDCRPRPRVAVGARERARRALAVYLLPTESVWVSPYSAYCVQRPPFTITPSPRAQCFYGIEHALPLINDIYMMQDTRTHTSHDAHHSPEAEQQHDTRAPGIDRWHVCGGSLAVSSAQWQSLALELGRRRADPCDRSSDRGGTPTRLRSCRSAPSEPSL
jgi:hypothetical protein